jgi:bifunctional enzyme CysN/CysC
LRLAVAGYVDHGKSTVIGRLLNDTRQVREDRFDKVKAFCENSGRRFEFAFLLDALEEEQQQGITIDVTEVPWVFRGREYTIIDTPGHKEFLKNMVGGASKADAALLVVDAQEGLRGHFQRQVAVMALLGVPKIIVALNKMDLVSWSEQVFREREQQLDALFKSAGLKPAQVIPVAAWQGANLLENSSEMPWYRGPTLAGAVADLPLPTAVNESALRFPLQDVYKFDDKRIYVGRVEAGTLKVGQKIKFLPSNRESVIRTIEVHGEPGRKTAAAGESVGITLQDPLFLERGELGFEPRFAPKVSRTITADLFWLAPQPLVAGKSYALRCGTSELRAQVETIESVLNPEDLAEQPDHELTTGAIGRVKFTLEKALAHDFFKDSESTGRFVLIEDYRVAGGGRILPDGRAFLSTELSQVTPTERATRFGHKGFVVWTTGLSGSGKSTIVRELERRLFQEGMNVFVLDGDNIRQGICGDLGFSRGDRGENIRRVAEVAKLFADAGSIVLTAFISPFEADRRRAREIIGEDRLVEIFVDCPLEECEKRDPKKLYAKARSGEFGEMTGITSPFEVPLKPDLHLRTDQLNSADCVARIRELVLNLAK